MTIGTSFLLALASSLVLTVSSSSQQPSSEANVSHSTSSAMPMPSVAPLFLEDATTRSEITIVNALVQSVHATLTLRDVHGDLLLTESLLFSAHEKKVLPVRSLLNKAMSFTGLGSITLDQDFRIDGVALLGQLSMTSFGTPTPAHVEEEFTMPEANGSRLLRGVVSETSTPPTIAVTSISDHVQTITLSCFGAASFTPTTRVLYPRSTVLIRACAETADHTAEDLLQDVSAITVASPRTYGVEISSTAKSEDFVAFGLTRTIDQMEAVEFADPKSLHSANTVYPGVPAGRSALLPEANYVPRVSIANFTTKPQVVSVFYASTAETSDSSLTSLIDITAPAMSAHTVSLTGLPAQADLTNSFIFRPTGGIGAVQTRLYAEGNDLLKRVELLGKDEKSDRNGGNHPFSVANGDTSTFLLFNYTAQEQTVQVTVSGETSEWLQVYQLKPYETKKLSIAKARRTARCIGSPTAPTEPPVACW